MLLEVKYIKTKDDDIIVFPACIEHREFGDWRPKSAGFIRFSVLDGRPICKCYGKSISLGLNSEEEDTNLAMNQLQLSHW